MNSDGISNLLRQRSGLFMAGLLLIVLAVGTLSWWLLRPLYVPLYQGVAEEAQADILGILSQANVPFRLNAAQGSIEVPASQAASARMRLAESAVPVRHAVGFELFDQADYGMSEFSQKINYQRALEGELARSIMSLSEVQQARVHITFRKQGLYQQAQDQPKASVIVRLRNNVGLSPARVQGIQQLLVSAVEGLVSEQVAVLDENGRLLSKSSLQLAPEQLQAVSDIERLLQDKALQLLARPLGQTGADVSVKVSMNFDRVRSVREQENEAQGRERSEIEYAQGRIERISVGIVLNQPMDEAQLQGLQALLSAALGLEAARGDRLVLAYLPTLVVSQSQWLPAEEERSMDAVAAEQLVSPISEASSPMLPWRDPVYLLLAMAALLLALLAWGYYRKRSSVPAESVRPLSQAERERLLSDLQQWLAREP